MSTNLWPVHVKLIRFYTRDCTQIPYLINKVGFTLGVVNHYKRLWHNHPVSVWLMINYSLKKTPLDKLINEHPLIEKITVMEIPSPIAKKNLEDLNIRI